MFHKMQRFFQYVSHYLNERHSRLPRVIYCCFAVMVCSGYFIIWYVEATWGKEVARGVDILGGILLVITSILFFWAAIINWNYVDEDDKGEK